MKLAGSEGEVDNIDFRLSVGGCLESSRNREFDSHCPTRRDRTVLSRRVESGGVNWALEDTNSLTA